MLNLVFAPATAQDATQLTALINSAYRGEPSRKGWTTEADLLAGRRTCIEDILNLLADENCRFLLAKIDGKLQASVLLQHSAEGVQLSMLAVNPLLQNQGIGKALLQQAELTAQQTWATHRLIMFVISCRSELIAFYQRRGYQRTGIYREFPIQSDLWTTKVDNLQLELLEKFL